MALMLLDVMFAIFLMSSPFWIPVVFVAYAVRAKRISLLSLFILTSAEALGLAAFLWFLQNGLPHRG